VNADATEPSFFASVVAPDDDDDDNDNIDEEVADDEVDVDEMPNKRALR